MTDVVWVTVHHTKIPGESAIHVYGAEADAAAEPDEIIVYCIRCSAGF